MSASLIGSGITTEPALISLEDALNRFDPPPGFNLGATEVIEKKVRYGFRAVGFSFLIRDRLISEVIPIMPFSSIPNAPNWLVGVINLHGNLVPICDFKRVIRSDGGESKKVDQMILVLGSGDSAAGFIIDGNPCAVINPQKTKNLSATPEWLVHCVSSAFISNNEVWLEFDYESFLKKASYSSV